MILVESELVYDALMDLDGNGFIYFPLFGYATGNFEAIRETMLHPQTGISLADGVDAGRIAEESGCAAIALHGRTVAQSYSGVADWDAIAALVKSAVLDGMPLLEAHILVNLRFQLTETRRDRASGHVHSVLRFRAVMEPAA